MSLTTKKVAVVGSREFNDYDALDDALTFYVGPEDTLISGGAIGADSMAQRWAKEHGKTIIIHYPNYLLYGKGATFARNRKIAQDADLILAFYSKDRFQKGGTAHTVGVGKELGKKVLEFKSRESNSVE